MKKSLVAASCLFYSFFAFSEELPILTKKEYTGYVAPGYNSAHICEIYASNKVVISNTYGQFNYSITKSVELSGNYKNMLENAEQGPFKSYTYPMDVGSLIYEGNILQNNGTYKKVKLGTKMGNNWSIENQSVGAYGLRLALDDLCK